ncbi:MAG: transglycosylase domain-containing protein [Balneolaceae bacterium]
MTKDSRPNSERYFNDPEYRRSIRQQRDADTSNDHLPKQGSSSSPSGRTGSIPWRNGNWITRSLLLLLLLGLLGGGGYLIYLFQGLPSVERLENPKTAIASVVLSRDGSVLDRYYVENRTDVKLHEISPHVVNALISTEDHRFFEHWGMDMIRTLAIPYHILRGNPQGGSTISQQLARNLYREIGQAFSVTRKFREMITAVQIEHNYTKEEIIEMYLNTVEFSNSAFGIESAAQTHYGKTAGELNVTEAATMIGTLQAVSFYNPRRNPENAQRRRNTVLSRMHQLGFIPSDEYASMREEPIRLDYHPPSRSGRESRYFGEYVRQQVTDWTEENGYDLYADGLTIHTTIDSRLQRHAERAVREKADSLQAIFEDEWTTPNGEYMDRFWSTFPNILPSFIRETDRYRNAFSDLQTDQESVVFEHLLADEAYVDSVKHARTLLQASFVSIDPSNGNVLAWVGGTDYGSKQFDHVYQSRRQTGSTFKPFVYAVAVDNGYMPYHTFSKYPVSFIDANGNRWDPRDPSIIDGPEQVPLREALARSMNNVTVRLLPEIAGSPGTNRLSDLFPAAEAISEMAGRMGIDVAQHEVVPSIALGTASASLLELVSAYTTFANEGVRIDPIAITRIEDKEGNILVEYHPEMTQEVLSPETAYIMIDMMRGVISGGEWGHGTGVRLRNAYNVRQDVAGKTGTTQNSADNWFVAMTPHMVMGAWVGGEDRRIRFPANTFIGQGARSALPIVGQFMQYASTDPTIEWSQRSFEPPPGFVMPEPPEQQESRQGSNEQDRIGW